MLRRSARLACTGLVALLAVLGGSTSLSAQHATPRTGWDHGGEPLSLGVPGSIPQRTSITAVPHTMPPTALLLIGFQEATGDGGGWQRGFLIGGLIGAGVGLVLHAIVDSFPCDTCSGTGSDSFADGTRLEFTVGFGLLGGGLGALLGR